MTQMTLTVTKNLIATMKTSKELIDELDKLDLTPELIYWEEYDEEDMPFTCVHREGGTEHVEFVIHFPEDDVYLLATATYISHYGIEDFEGWTEVRPYEKTITVYR